MRCDLAPATTLFLLYEMHTHITLLVVCHSGLWMNVSSFFPSAFECERCMHTMVLFLRGGDKQKKKKTRNSQPNAKHTSPISFVARCSNNLRLCVAMRKLNILLLGTFLRWRRCLLCENKSKKYVANNNIIIPESCRIFIHRQSQKKHYSVASRKMSLGEESEMNTLLRQGFKAITQYLGMVFCETMKIYDCILCSCSFWQICYEMLFFIMVYRTIKIKSCYQKIVKKVAWALFVSRLRSLRLVG